MTEAVRPPGAPAPQAGEGACSKKRAERRTPGPGPRRPLSGGVARGPREAGAQTKSYPRTVETEG